MQIGISVAYWPWFELDEVLALATTADRLGFDSVWVAEAYGQDAVAVLGAIAGVTERIGLGAGIFQIPARQPTTTAAAAATLDRLSGGRVRLGLGLSGPQVSEGWYGVPFTAPLRRTREYVEIVRMALAGQAVEYHGTDWDIPATHGGLGLGKPLKMLGAPVQQRLPIYLGVGGEQTVRQAGQLADGWLPFLFSPEHGDMLMAPLLDGIAAAGRERGDLDVAANVPAAIADDIEQARDAVRPMLAFYFGAMGAKDKNFYVDLAERYGHGDSARACQDRFLAGDRKGAEAAITIELLELVSLAATPATVEKKLAAYAAADVDTLVLTPFGDRHRSLQVLSQHLAAFA